MMPVLQSRQSRVEPLMSSMLRIVLAFLAVALPVITVHLAMKWLALGKIPGSVLSPALRIVAALLAYYA